MNSNMVEPEKFGHLHLVYHFTVPLRLIHPLVNTSRAYLISKLRRAVLTGGRRLLQCKTSYASEILKHCHFFLK